MGRSNTKSKKAKKFLKNLKDKMKGRIENKANPHIVEKIINARAMEENGFDKPLLDLDLK